MRTLTNEEMGQVAGGWFFSWGYKSCYTKPTYTKTCYTYTKPKCEPEPVCEPKPVCRPVEPPMVP